MIRPVHNPAGRQSTQMQHKDLADARADAGFAFPSPLPPIDHDPRITIVSGLPRSGTSLMMQMLSAGGMTVLTDGCRTADISNPAGYFELEAVKQTRTNTAWLTHAAGSAVKVIYRLLYDLPLNRRYRILFMRRNIGEVIASQRAMLGLLSENADGSRRLADIFTRELAQIDAWLAAKAQFQVLHVDHAQVLASPHATAEAVAAFLDRRLDLNLMCQAVKPDLYRQKCR